MSQLSDAELPLFPLGSVLFPGGTMALKIFEQRYLEMAKSALKAGTPFGISLIRQGNEVGAPAVPEGVGTIALITHWDMQNLGILQLKIRGEQRFKLLSLSTSRSGLIMGTVT
ncbi:MAG: LON peptidase substrate-binding domain-containing protein, partial [Burkholderiales bacterium]|nr:LON peptidase substrate-binding domain-containing protein [Burkholderiales bacterium]